MAKSSGPGDPAEAGFTGWTTAARATLHSDMSSSEPPDFAAVDRALRSLGSLTRAPEAHGSLCGYTCVLGAAAHAPWVAELLDEPSEAQDDDVWAGAVLADLATRTCAALGEGDMSFAPLVPPDDAPLTARTDGLAEWCSGFMRGLGQAAGRAPAALSGEITREIIADFAEIARAAVDTSDHDEIGAEAAFAELVEFVRVSVQLVFEELHAVRDNMSRPGLH
jgi:hypothetical protein